MNIKRLHQKLSEVKNLYLYIGFVLTSWAIGLLSVFINQSIETPFTRPKFESTIEEVVVVLFFAPFFESLIFQFYIIEFNDWVFKRSRFRIFSGCLLSSLAFSLIHLYSFIYFLFALMIGSFFAYFYCIEKLRTNGFRAGICVISLHFSYNLFALLWNHLLVF